MIKTENLETVTILLDYHIVEQDAICSTGNSSVVLNSVDLLDVALANY